MPRTFSLLRLMLGITAFCILCALAVNFPEVVLIFGPTVLACAVRTYFSRNRIGTLVGCVFGALFGTLLMPGVGIDGFGSFAVVALPPALCAALAGSILVLGESVNRETS